MELDAIIKTRAGKFRTGVVKCEAVYKKNKIKKFKHLKWIPMDNIDSREDVNMIIGDDSSFYVSIDEYFAIKIGYDVRAYAIIKIKRGLNASNLWINYSTSETDFQIS